MCLLLILSSLLAIHTVFCIPFECTFPCINNQVCEITNNFMRCNERTNSTEWILRNATSLPEFVGNTVVIGQSCTRVPMPNTTWHPIGTYDEYLSNCQQSAYCELTSLCVRKLTHGEVCMSSNQCAHLSCINQTCQIGQSSSNTNTVYIVLYVVGSVLFVVIVACIYLVARKRKKRRQEDVPLPKPDNQHVFDVLDRNFNNDSVQRLSDDKPPPPYSP